MKTSLDRYKPKCLTLETIHKDYCRVKTPNWISLQVHQTQLEMEKGFWEATICQAVICTLKQMLPSVNNFVQVSLNFSG